MLDPKTGQIHDSNATETEQHQGFVPIRRPLTQLEKMDAKVEPHSDCVCGSGKRFRFCCMKGGGK